ncbi:serine/threonine-protein kinase [Streptomyces sp. NPDC001584]|uniref:serine/threonine-protein kinase n=1 Tax=Streptomyces sp. NPDC001584 TaxID=3154521 RepID=UPI0033315E7A
MAAVFPRRLARRFEPVRPVGRGGMGTVFEAEDTRLRRRVAVKVLTAHGTVSRTAAERFEAEALALARISHPNVVGVHDAGIDEGSPYLVMEFLDGSDVSDLVRRGGALPEREACRIAADTLLGLGAAHARGVLHRDVKPANVRVTANGRVVLYDFGLARLTDEVALTNPGDLLGTPQYMAPECITGQSPQAASDVYGVGACLHFMLTGASPFGEVRNLDVLLFRAVHDGMPSLRDSLPAAPAGLADAVDALSALDLTARTSSAAAAEALIRPWAVRGGIVPLDNHASGEEPAPLDDDIDDLVPLDNHASGEEPAPLDNHPSGPSPSPSPAPLRAQPAGIPEYDWGQVDVRPDPHQVPEDDHVALSESTRRLVRSNMTEKTALSRQRKAVGLIQRGRLREAVDLLSGIAAFCAETLGPGHPTTLACQYWQAVCLARQGHAPQALELFARVGAHHGQGRDTEDE